jgi:hypothetical protein
MSPSTLPTMDSNNETSIRLLSLDAIEPTEYAARKPSIHVLADDAVTVGVNAFQRCSQEVQGQLTNESFIFVSMKIGEITCLATSIHYRFSKQEENRHRHPSISSTAFVQ